MNPLAFCPETLLAFDFLLSILRIQAPLLTFPMADITVEPRAPCTNPEAAPTNMKHAFATSAAADGR